MDRIRLAKEIHETAIDKGWWDKKRNHDEIFMLIITELAEAIEADRKERWVSIADFDKYESSLKPPEMFKKLIKDTVEDEVADAYIRCLDYLYYRHREYFTVPDIPVEFENNFAENIFSVCRQVGDRFINNAAAYIEKLCEHEDINLEWHVREKMNFNAQREHKHGGKKY